MNEYIIIRRCKSETAWYRNKIGHVYKLLDYQHPDFHYVKISRKKRYANIGIVNVEEAEIITAEIMANILFQNIIIVTVSIVAIILKLFV